MAANDASCGARRCRRSILDLSIKESPATRARQRGFHEERRALSDDARPANYRRDAPSEKGLTMDEETFHRRKSEIYSEFAHALDSATVRKRQGRIDALERKALAQFVQAVRLGDLPMVVELFGLIDEEIRDGWRRAFLRLAKIDRVTDEMQTCWLRINLKFGDHIRQEVGNDRLLICVLRVLLPPYRGPAMTLFRGDGALARKHRTYGASWTSDRAVAESHAAGLWRQSTGGSVLLQTVAPPDAIICAVSSVEDRYGETEYLVDRRRLGPVTVLRRFSHRQLLPAKRVTSP